MKLEFCGQIFEKYANMNFNENPASESSSMRTDGRTDMTKLMVASRNFANAPNNRKLGKLYIIADFSHQSSVCCSQLAVNHSHCHTATQFEPNYDRQSARPIVFDSYRNNKA